MEIWKTWAFLFLMEEKRIAVGANTSGSLFPFSERIRCLNVIGMRRAGSGK